MIGFGELRKISVQWQIDVTQVERVYVIDWMLKGIFDHATLSQSLILRGGSALRYVYSSEFPLAEDPEFLMTRVADDDAMHHALTAGLNDATNASGLKFTITSFSRGAGKIEYTGPLGRRSAAQPRVALSIIPGKPHLEPKHLPLIHPFSDDCHATVSVIALDECVGTLIAAFIGTPRTRDVYNLWFAMTKLRDRLNASQVGNIARTIAQEKNVALPRPDTLLDSSHRASLERAWDNALREVPGHPSFAQVEHDLKDALKLILAD